LTTVNFLRRGVSFVESLTPGLLAQLDATPFAQKETRGNPTLEMFRQAKGPSLIIPKEMGGMGVTPVDAIRFQRAIAASAPSTALATNMHHFTVALLTEFATVSPQIRYLLRNSAESSMFLASGFAEGASAQSTLKPTMAARANGSNYVLSGSKKPCSLCHSMDVLTASVSIESEKGGPRFGVAIIPANSAGLTIKPFWVSPILAGAESDDVVLENVVVAKSNMFVPGDELDPGAMQANSFIWFQLLTSSCYLGIGSALMVQLIQRRKGTIERRVDLACELEGAMAMLEGVAYAFQNGERGDALIARALFVRYAIQRSLVRVAADAAEMLGGMAYATSETVSYLMAAVRCLAFHPPSKAAVDPSLDKFLAGEPFQFV
jgi:alkylation response protein AidB-like acyl-CoA dehydrogenase